MRSSRRDRSIRALSFKVPAMPFGRRRQAQGLAERGIPPNLKSYVCIEVFEGQRPVLYVTRSDGDWCFLCGEEHPDDAAVSRSRVEGGYAPPDLLLMATRSCHDPAKLRGPERPLNADSNRFDTAHARGAPLTVHRQVRWLPSQPPRRPSLWRTPINETRSSAFSEVSC